MSGARVYVRLVVRRGGTGASGPEEGPSREYTVK